VEDDRKKDCGFRRTKENQISLALAKSSDHLNRAGIASLSSAKAGLLKDFLSTS
jgi:hypothetical protein